MARIYSNHTGFYPDKRHVAGAHNAPSYSQSSIHSPLLDAAARHDPERLQRLIEAGHSVNAHGRQGETALHQACLHTDHEAAIKLVAFGAKVNARDHNLLTPLHWACFEDDTKMVDFLIQSGAKLNLRSRSYGTPLHLACSRGCAQTAERLVTAGADIHAMNSLRMYPIDVAQAFNNEEVVKLLRDWERTLYGRWGWARRIARTFLQTH